MRDEGARLRDIVEAIAKIEAFTARGRAHFDSSELIQVGVAWHLQVIGEAASKLKRKTREAAPQVRWPDVVKMRNFLVHRYFDIDLDVVWDSVEHDLPLLKRDVEKLLRDLNG